MPQKSLGAPLSMNASEWHSSPQIMPTTGFATHIMCTINVLNTLYSLPATGNWIPVEAPALCGHHVRGLQLRYNLVDR